MGGIFVSHFNIHVAWDLNDLSICILITLLVGK